MSGAPDRSAPCVRAASVVRGGRSILTDASLSPRVGELTCLVGPNGSGKSTLLRLLSGLWAPDSGEASLGGRSLQRWERREVARRVALVPQHTRLGFDFTVREVVAMGRYPHEGRLSRGRSEQHPAVQAALERADVAAFADRDVTTLSGGEAQRVLLARCLAAQADTLLLDEPTSALDLRHALAVMSLCRDLARDGRAVVVALHDLSAALRWADRCVVMQGGRIVADGPPGSVLTAERIRDVFEVTAERIETADGELLLRFDER